MRFGLTLGVRALRISLYATSQFARLDMGGTATLSGKQKENNIKKRFGGHLSSGKFSSRRDDVVSSVSLVAPTDNVRLLGLQASSLTPSLP